MFSRRLFTAPKRTLALFAALSAAIVYNGHDRVDPAERIAASSARSEAWNSRRQSRARIHASRQGPILGATGFHFERSVALAVPPLQAADGSSFPDSFSVVVGDINGDRKDDIVAASIYNRTHVFLQGETGGFSPPSTHVFGGFCNDDWICPANDVVVADFNRDGIADVIAAGVVHDDEGTTPAFNALLSSLSSGSGTFAPAQARMPGWNWIRGWKAVDVDSDGNPDIVGLPRYCDEPDAEEAKCNEYSIAYGDGTGRFPRVSHGRIGNDGGYWLTGLDSVDLNRDGLQDLLFRGSRRSTLSGRTMGGIWALVQDRNGAFEPPRWLHQTAHSPLPEWPLGIVAGDFNSDGQADIAPLASIGWPLPSIVTLDRFLNVAARYDLPVELGLKNLGSGSEIARDFDGDRRTDLISAVWRNLPNGQWIRHVAVMLQRQGALQAPIYYPVDDIAFGTVSEIERKIGFGDLNGDGCGDLAVASEQTVIGSSVQVHAGRECFRRIQPRSGNLPPL